MGHLQLNARWHYLKFTLGNFFLEPGKIVGNLASHHFGSNASFGGSPKTSHLIHGCSLGDKNDRVIMLNGKCSSNTLYQDVRAAHMEMTLTKDQYVILEKNHVVYKSDGWFVVNNIVDPKETLFQALHPVLWILNDEMVEFGIQLLQELMRLGLFLEFLTQLVVFVSFLSAL